MSKEVYLITTRGCVSCSIMIYHLRKINQLSSCKYVLNIVDFKNVPEFISLNVPLELKRLALSSIGHISSNFFNIPLAIVTGIVAWLPL